MELVKDFMIGLLLLVIMVHLMVRQHLALMPLCLILYFKQKKEEFHIIEIWQDIQLYLNIYKWFGNECICPNEKDEIFEFDVKETYKSKLKAVEYNALKSEFDYVINIVLHAEDEIFDLFEKWLIDGEMFWEICPNSEGTAIESIKILPPFATMPVYNDGLIMGFIEDLSLISGETKNKIREFHVDQIAYSSYGEFETNKTDVRGYLEKAMRPINQLKAIEDSLVVYRLTRAPEKRIWNVYGGKVNPSKAMENLKKVQNNYRKNYSIDPDTGMINASKNTQSLTEDIWFVKDQDGQGSTVESFKGAVEFNGQLDDLNMFRSQVAEALYIPRNRAELSGEATTTYNVGTEIDFGQLDFQKFGHRMQQKFMKLVYDVYIAQLRLRGFKEKYLDRSIYACRLCKNTYFEKVKFFSQMETRGNILGSFASYLPNAGNSLPDSDEPKPLIATRTLMEDILQFDTNFILKNEKNLQLEIEKIIKDKKAAIEENGDTEEGPNDLEL